MQTEGLLTETSAKNKKTCISISVCVCVVHDKTIYMAILKIKKQVEIDRPVVSTTNEAVRCSADVQCKPKHVRIESCVCVACESRSSFNCDLP